MAQWHDVLVHKLKEHSSLSHADVAAIRGLPSVNRALGPHEDIVRQGDRPKVSVVVLKGMMARYHTLPGGGRQYLSIHIAGDMPDAQSLFLERMDHAVCAMDEVVVATVPHRALLNLFNNRPVVGFAFWRETLIDAAIFREAITNNGARPLQTRLAHFCCEQFYRARKAGLITGKSCRLPLTQTEIGEALGTSLPSITRGLQKLRESGAMEMRGGLLHVPDWDHLVKLGDFDPAYLHLKKPD